jgi:hypothetical protein
VKALIAAVVALGIAVTASPSMAYVVMVTTSVPMTSVADETQLKTALASAVDDVLAHAIGFTPTVVSLEAIRVVGDRMYLLMMIADAEGESSMDGMSGDEPTSAEPERESPPRFTY